MRSPVERVDAPRPVGDAAREARVAQHAEVVRHGRLADAELGADHVGEVARRAVAVREELDETSPDRISEDVECVHATIHISSMLI